MLVQLSGGLLREGEIGPPKEAKVISGDEQYGIDPNQQSPMTGNCNRSSNACPNVTYNTNVIKKHTEGRQQTPRSPLKKKSKRLNEDNWQMSLRNVATQRLNDARNPSTSK